jgi:hypothetical protein
MPLSIQPEILKRGAGLGEGETVSISPAIAIAASQRASEKIKRCFINEPAQFGELCVHFRDFGRGLSMNQVQNG